MSDLPSLTPRAVERILLKNGSELDYREGSHRVYGNSGTGRWAAVPFHRRDLPKGDLLSILKQASMEEKDLL
ncbi:type II toxin-antitoxin system HicA family toxin [bacterium]|nr:type II toxin-antitoxin system HicA family toxin [bacterium]